MLRKNSSDRQILNFKKMSVASLVAALECPICLEGFDNSQHKPMILPCSHSFCNSCVIALSCKPNAMCPNCTTHFQLENIHPNFIVNSIVEQVNKVANKTKKTRVFEELVEEENGTREDGGKSVKKRKQEEIALCLKHIGTPMDCYCETCRVCSDSGLAFVVCIE